MLVVQPQVKAAGAGGNRVGEIGGSVDVVIEQNRLGFGTERGQVSAGNISRAHDAVIDVGDEQVGAGVEVGAGLEEQTGSQVV